MDMIEAGRGGVGVLGVSQEWITELEEENLIEKIEIGRRVTTPRKGLGENLRLRVLIVHHSFKQLSHSNNGSFL